MRNRILLFCVGFLFCFSMHGQAWKNGELKMSIAVNTIEGATTVNKFGRNIDIDGGPEDIWDGGGVWAAPTQHRIHNITSTSALDTIGGTGAQTVEVMGLDSNWVEATETIILSGTDDVATTNSYVIIFRMKVLTAGSGGSNAGTITATAVTDATITAQITIGNNQTLMAIYAVPANKTLLITGYFSNFLSAINNPAQSGAKINMWVKPFGQVWQLKHTTGNTWSGNHIHQKFEPYFKVTEKSLIRISAPSTTDNDSDIAAGFDGYLLSNNILKTRKTNIDF